ncbi:ATP-dependent DNA helicase [Trichonephila clavipes]|uniref:ATP-dependent DNA helicase n=1 Tax=Trichonephila clavipes TaxID=2585209 RepID=A0A8X6V887_TRICX|nr:ATP-dependent DNA helicase [Trichonephila clavipes]
MPRKWKSGLSKNSSRARAAKIARNQESSVHAELRRQQRQSILRAAETPLQARVHSETQAELQAARRAIETPQQSQARKIHNAEIQSSRRRNFIRKDWSVFNGTRFRYDASIEYHNHPLNVIGSKNKKCHYCDAFKLNDETAGMCCSSGKVSLPFLGEPGEPLKTLLLSVTNESKQFLRKIRKYISCFPMTSFGVDKGIRMPGFSPTFTVQGQIYHHIGSLFPEGNDRHEFLPIYFMGDEQNEVNRRCQYIEGVERETVLKIQQMLHSHNVLLKIFKSAIGNSGLQIITMLSFMLIELVIMHRWSMTLLFWLLANRALTET